MKVTALCNIYVNSETKLGLFKQTFPRVYHISDNWLIYIRGNFRDTVEDFVRANMSEVDRKCTFFKNLDDGNWAKSTSQIIEHAQHSHIYIFLEDHFLVKNIRQFRQILVELKAEEIDYFQYSFFGVGLPINSIEILNPKESDNFFSFNLTPDLFPLLIRNCPHFYPFSLVSVVSKKYLKNLLFIEQKKIIQVPRFIQVALEIFGLPYPRNRILWFWLNRTLSFLGLRLTIYSPATPFNLEKSLHDCDESLLPINVGILREELFANWDDDNGVTGSSLLKRGLYPATLKADPPTTEDADLRNAPVIELKKGESISRQYYPDTGRIFSVPLKKIHVQKGKLRIKGADESYDISEGNEIWIHANIPHILFALENCAFQVYID